MKYIQVNTVPSDVLVPHDTIWTAFRNYFEGRDPSETYDKNYVSLSTQDIS